MHPRRFVKIGKASQRSHFAVQLGPVILTQLSPKATLPGTTDINIRLSVIIDKNARVNRRRYAVNHPFHFEVRCRFFTCCHENTPCLRVNSMRKIEIVQFVLFIISTIRCPHKAINPHTRLRLYSSRVQYFSMIRPVFHIRSRKHVVPVHAITPPCRLHVM